MAPGVPGSPRDPTDRADPRRRQPGHPTAWLREHAHRRHRARGRHVHRRDPLLLRRQGRGADRRAQVGERTSLRQARRALAGGHERTRATRAGHRGGGARARPRRGEYVLWIELWVRALQEPQLLPVCEELSRRWRSYFYEPVRRGAESGEFEPGGRARRGRRAPDRARRRARSGVAARLLVDLPDRMRERVDSFVSGATRHQSRGARARDAHAAVAAVEELGS